MNPTRKRKTRFTIALTVALLLAGALAYTSFSAASEAVQPSQLATGAHSGQVYQLTGKVAPGSWRHEGVRHSFRVEDRAGGTTVPVVYYGSVPDAFREGREVIVDVQKRGGVFVGEKDSLITKCPSKFSADQQAR